MVYFRITHLKRHCIPSPAPAQRERDSRDGWPGGQRHGKPISYAACRTMHASCSHYYTHKRILQCISVADRGFSPGGCANSQNCYYFSNFCQKLHENERIWTPRGGGRVPGAPLRSANVFICDEHLSNGSWSLGTHFLRRPQEWIISQTMLKIYHG